MATSLSMKAGGCRLSTLAAAGCSERRQRQHWRPVIVAAERLTVVLFRLADEQEDIAGNLGRPNDTLCWVEVGQRPCCFRRTGAQFLQLLIVTIVSSIGFRQEMRGRSPAWLPSACLRLMHGALRPNIALGTPCDRHRTIANLPATHHEALVFSYAVLRLPEGPGAFGARP